MSMLKIKITRSPVSLVILTILWCSSTFSSHFLLAANLASELGDVLENTDKNSGSGGFEVWLYEHLQISVELLTDKNQLLGAEKKFDICLNSNSESSPVHLAISIDTEMLNHLKKSTSKYSFTMKGPKGWRNSGDFFDYLIHSSLECVEKNRVEFGYKIETMDRMRPNTPDYVDTITLRVRPE